LIGLEALSTDEANVCLGYRIGDALKGKLPTAVTADNAQIPATLDPFDEHWGSELKMIKALLWGAQIVATPYDLVSNSESVSTATLKRAL
jgi:hypothetical protein